jgi:hypothetical protein
LLGTPASDGYPQHLDAQQQGGGYDDQQQGGYDNRR